MLEWESAHHSYNDGDDTGMILLDFYFSIW